MSKKGLSISEAAELAVEHEEAGRLHEAEEIYREILRDEPENADILHRLGLLSHRTGDYDAAAALISRAVEIAPQNAEAHKSLGNAVRMQGRMAEAVRCYRRAIEVDPDYAIAHNNLGNALTEQGQLDEAVMSYRRALAIDPGYAVAHDNIQIALTKQQMQALSMALDFDLLDTWKNALRSLYESREHRGIDGTLHTIDLTTRISPLEGRKPS